MSETVYTKAQDLDTDPLVELWELDTTMLSNVYGETGAGDIYRWTPGILNYREEGACTVGSISSAQTIFLDRILSIANTALTYQMQVENQTTGQFSAPLKIVGWASGTDSHSTPITIVYLESPLQTAPAEGTRWLIESTGQVFFGGVEYKPAPIELTGMEWSGQGKLPRPRLRVVNHGGLAAALVIQFGDIVGATVTRFQTFKSFLDGEANASASAIMEPDVFTVDRKATHNKHVLEFDLAAGLDQQGIRVPKRIVLRNSCDHTYRQWSLIGYPHFIYGSCPYTGDINYLSDGTYTWEPSKDLCGKRLTDCMLRFPNNDRLPFRGFPGVADIKV